MTNRVIPWTVRLPKETAGQPHLSPSLFATFIALEHYARRNPFTWVSNDRLAADLRVAPRSVRRRLAALEALGYIARVVPDRAKGDRMGILMRRRVDPASPTCVTRKDMEEAAERLRDRWSDATSSDGKVPFLILGVEADSGPEGCRELSGAQGDGDAPHLGDGLALPQGDGNVRRIRSNSEGTTNKQEGPPPCLDRERELTREQVEAVESVRKEAQDSDRPGFALGLASVARDAIARGHSPVRVAEMARVSLAKANPPGWLREAIRRRADEEGGILEDRREPTTPQPTQSIVIDPEDRDFYDAAPRARRVGIGCGPTKPRLSGRAN